jgi:hypothetical protein
MAYRSTDPKLQKMYATMMSLATDTTSELYHEGRQRSGAGHRAAFWDGYNGVKITPHVIPGTFSAACAAAGRDFRRQQDKLGAPLVEAVGYALQRSRVRGRPSLPPEQRQTERIEMRCTKAQRAKLDRLGGIQWLRDRIDRAHASDSGGAAGGQT